MARKKAFTIMLDDKELNKQIKRAMQNNPKETVKAVNACVLDLAAASAKRAPIESGDLRNDAHATLNGITVFQNQEPTGLAPAPTTQAVGTVGYSLPYALRQHEELNYQHDRTDGYKRLDGTTVNMVAGGEAKFLENPFEERKERYIRRLEQIPERSLR